MEPICLGPFQLDGIDNFRQAAIEIIDVSKAAGPRSLRGSHLPEETANQIIGVRALFRALVQNLGNEFAEQKANVFSNHRYEQLQNESLRALAIFASSNNLAKHSGHLISRLACDFDAVVAEDWFPPNRQQEIERGDVLGEFARRS